MLATLPFTTSHAEWIGLLVSAVSLIGIGGILTQFVCHKSGCYRRGRFRYGHYRLCHVHHPNVPSDGKIDTEHIAAAGREHHDQAAETHGPARPGEHHGPA